MVPQRFEATKGLWEASLRCGHLLPNPSYATMLAAAWGLYANDQTPKRQDLRPERRCEPRE